MLPIDMQFSRILDSNPLFILNLILRRTTVGSLNKLRPYQLGPFQLCINITFENEL